MKFNARKPTKFSAVIGAAFGIILLYLGVTIAIPEYGLLTGLLWVAIAVGITAYQVMVFLKIIKEERK